MAVPFSFWRLAKKGGRPRTGLYEEATQSVPDRTNPTDSGDAADLSAPQGIGETVIGREHPSAEPRLLGRYAKANRIAGHAGLNRQS